MHSPMRDAGSQLCAARAFLAGSEAWGTDFFPSKLLQAAGSQRLNCGRQAGHRGFRIVFPAGASKARRSTTDRA